jgi:release factor glutamine methyltransferase
MTAAEALAAAAQSGLTPIAARALIAHITRRDPAHLLAHLEDVLSSEQADQARDRIHRASAGEPLAYLIGYQEFCGLRFAVSPAVLIPRPETELLVEATLKWVAQSGHPAPRILDVGTGSGAIAITLAVRIPHAHITAADISPDALAIARANAESHGVSDRIIFLQSDLLSETGNSSPLPEGVILANLPYIPTPSLPALDVSHHEPVLALDGGPDGLDQIRRLIDQAPAHLAPGGLLALEIQFDQADQVSALLRSVFPTATLTVIKDLAGLDRVMCAHLPEAR